MDDELKEIDTSTIAELVRIREQEDLIQQRLQKMEAGKSSVSPAVYERVERDYQSRLAALDAEARPLRLRARQEYAKLRARQTEAERGLQEAASAREELNFRHELGEFEGSDFARRSAESDKDLAARQARADRIGALQDRFRKAFRSDQELEGPEPAPLLPAPEIPPPASPAATRPGVLVPADAHESTAASATSAPVAAAAPDEPTIRRDESPLASATVVAPSLPSGLNPTSSQATRVIPAARVVHVVDGSERREFLLKPGPNSIGRTPKNEIELPFNEISRRHAEITLTEQGFRIVDLNSNNGVFINGTRVQEHLLADGDVIEVGTQRLVFRG